MTQVRADLHYHGPSNWLNTPRWNAIELAKLGAGKLDLMAITVMNPDDRRWQKLVENSYAFEKDGRVQIEGVQIYVPEYKLVLARTQEFATFDRIDKANFYKSRGVQGHLLVFGNPRLDENSFDGLVEAANSEGCAICLDHWLTRSPIESFSRSFAGALAYQGREKIYTLFVKQKLHAVEWSGLMQAFDPVSFLVHGRESNQEALTQAVNKGIPLIANSDGHYAFEAGRAHTLFDFDGRYVEPFQYYPEIITCLRKNLSSNTEIKPKGVAGLPFSASLHAAGLILEKIGFWK